MAYVLFLTTHPLLIAVDRVNMTAWLFLINRNGNSFWCYYYVYIYV